MPLQRRYSVTGQTPPDDVTAMKSPKLQALDTSVQTSCGLCEAEIPCADAPADDMDLDEPKQERGRKTGHHAIVRTSSKRSATQLPSPSSPSQDLPIKKMNCMGLHHMNMSMNIDVDMDLDLHEGSLTDPCPEESDWALSSYGGSSPASLPSSPESAPTSLPAHVIDGPFDLARLEKPETLYIEDVVAALGLPPPATTTTTTTIDALPPTLLTLPPEIRHQIYRHLPDLVLSHPLIYCLSTFANNMQHPLASVSRLIRREALAIFYSYNTWIIKLEFKIMYDAFQDWIIRLGDGAASLRLVNIAVRGSLFKPRTSHLASLLGTNGQLALPAANAAATQSVYHPPDGDASFSIDLSEKWAGGKVEVLRNDGTREAGERARLHLQKLVNGLWEKRRNGSLNGQDWVDLVDSFLSFTGWW